MIVSLALAASMLLAQAGVQNGNAATIPPEAGQILQLINQARAEAGAGRLQWDTALAEAARQHCLRMTTEESIELQNAGEPALTDRASHAGAHFSLIAQNVATGSAPADIYGGWMRSPSNRTNLLNPQMDRIGVAIVASHGVLYAVADFEHAVAVLTQSQVEAAIAGLLRHSGITVLRDMADTTAARVVCVTDKPLSISEAGRHPRFVLRWQDSDLTHLPQALMVRIQTPLYNQAAVGSCPAQDVKGTFTTYRVAVLLY
ncbi:MAG TPA: CAP domain-containing protein [Acidobacteriaceae bacterium]|nr:CAP domain-containing protein [Acidobacteriaceae bacterium]